MTSDPSFVLIEKCKERLKSFPQHRYNALLVAMHTKGSDINLFMHHLVAFFDIILLLTDEQHTDLGEIAKNKKICIVDMPASTPVSTLTLFEIAKCIHSKWVCHMHTCEYLDPRFNDLEKLNNCIDIKYVFFHKVLSLDNSHYFVLPGSLQGTYPEARLFNKDLCSGEDILDFSLSPEKKYRGDNFLLIHNVSNKNIKGIHLQSEIYSLDGIYSVYNQFDHYDKIKDEQLPDYIRQKNAKITDHLLHKEAYLGSISLYSGDSGTALYMAVMYLRTKDSKYLEKLHALIDMLDHYLETGNNILSSFCGGLAGYGWLINYLHKHKLISVQEDYFEDLDAILTEHLHALCKQGLFDPLHQAISIGRYFIARNNKKVLKSIIGALDTWKESSFDEVKWKNFNVYHQTWKYDFGLAHGMAGYLYFIGKCYQLGVERNICKEWIDGIFTFYKHNEQDISRYPAFFPIGVPVEDYAPLCSPSHSRVAWCYGDLGALYSLYLCGLNTGNMEMKKFAVERLKHTAKRQLADDVLIRDAMFCHGSSSVAYMFNKMYRYTGVLAFREAAVFWYKASVLFGSNNTSETGYYFLIDAKEWGKKDDLLEGVLGVGLSFLSALDYEYMDWDECMMLS